MEHNIFLIGPASVGKSTVSELLAREIGYTFIDIDLIFCKEVALIPDYITEYGYVAYCQQNSTLVDELIARYPSKTVFATPAGFLVHEDSPELVSKHLKVIANRSISILLLPSFDPNEHVDIIIERQLKRYPEIDIKSIKTTEIYR